MRYTWVSVIALFALNAYAAAAGAAQRSWPTVTPLTTSKVLSGFAASSADAPFVVSIRDSTGHSVYKLECHRGLYDNDTETTFSGEYQCIFFATDHNRVASGNLFAADTPNESSAAWWNRGRVLASQLRGECLQFPEISTDRHFSFRNMRISLRLAQITWSTVTDQQGAQRLDGFTLTVTVSPDTRATSASALPLTRRSIPSACYP